MKREEIEKKWAEIERAIVESTKELYGDKGLKTKAAPLHKDAKVEAGKEGVCCATDKFDASEKMDNTPANKNKEGADESAEKFEGSDKAPNKEKDDRKEGAEGGAEVAKDGYAASSFGKKVRATFGLSLDDKLNKPNMGKEGLSESSKEMYGDKGFKPDSKPMHKDAEVKTRKDGAEGAADEFDASKKMETAPANKNKEGAEEAAKKFEGDKKAAGKDEGVDRKEGAAGGATIAKEYIAKAFREKVRGVFGLSLDDKLNKPNMGKEGLSESKKKLDEAMFVPGDKFDDEGNRVTRNRERGAYLNRMSKSIVPASKIQQLPFQSATPEEAQQAADEFKKQWEANKAQSPQIIPTKIELARMDPNTYIKIGLKPTDNLLASRQWTERLYDLAGM
jgi:hypothetical protein